MADNHCQAIDDPTRIYPWRDPRFPQAGQRFAIGRQLVECPEYGQLWGKQHNWELLEKAGFFDETHGNTKPFKRTTSKSKLSINNLGLPEASWLTPMPQGNSLGKNPVVLLLTGSFAPVHLGHLHIIEQAEKALLAKGINLIATYISPSHDNYVRNKYHGECQAYHAELRIDQLAEFLINQQAGRRGGQQHPIPRLIDPWEAMMNDWSVNFIRVIHHLEQQLYSFWQTRVKVIYLFGSDNAGFAEAFAAGISKDSNQWQVVCVERPGFTNYDKKNGTLYVSGNNRLSSRQVRQMSQTNPTSVSKKRIFDDPSKDRDQQRALPPRSNQENIVPSYIIRDDGEHAYSHWQALVERVILAEAWDEFANKVKEILQNSFNEASPPLKLPFKMITLAEQYQLVTALSQQQPVISLDTATCDLPNVWAYPRSRVFQLDGRQQQSQRLEWRPNWPSPREYPKKAILVDDDRATGLSITTAHEHLAKQEVEIIAERFLLAEKHIFDVVDLRDFLPGARDGGLVIEVKGKLVRLPYMAPFVNLNTRAKIPAGTAWRASQQLWEAAEQFFHKLPFPLRVQNMDPPSRTAFQEQGWRKETLLSELCHSFSAIIQSQKDNNNGNQGKP